MKKINMTFYVILLSFVIIMCNLSVAKADAINEPSNSFANKHIDECEYKTREYLVNDTAKLYESPYSTIVTGKLKKNDKIVIQFTYKDSDGCVWGLKEDSGESGWLDLSLANVVYDNYSFLEEHKDDISETDKSIKICNNLILWKFPFSEEKVYTFNKDDIIEGNLKFDSIYRDEKKREWGYIRYYCAMEGWVCIDDPTNDKINLDNKIAETKQPVMSNETTETQDNMKAVQSDNDSSQVGQKKKDKQSVVVYIVIIGLVATAIGSTVVIVKKNWKKKEERGFK